jgi:hypothetical protein
LEKHSLEGGVEGDQNEIEAETDIKEVKCDEKTTNTVESDTVTVLTFPLIPVRHAVDQNNLSEGEVIEYLVLKGNYMLSKHEDYEPLPKAIEKVMVFMGVNVLSLSLSLHFSLISLATFSILTEEDTS